jgi:hypothetical protein
LHACHRAPFDNSSVSRKSDPAATLAVRRWPIAGRRRQRELRAQRTGSRQKVGFRTGREGWPGLTGGPRAKAHDVCSAAAGAVCAAVEAAASGPALIPIARSVARSNQNWSAPQRCSDPVLDVEVIAPFADIDYLAGCSTIHGPLAQPAVNRRTERRFKMSKCTTAYTSWPTLCLVRFCLAAAMKRRSKRAGTRPFIAVNGTASSMINLRSQVHHATQQNIGNVGGDFGNACGEAYLPPNGDHIARVRGLRALRRYRLETRRLECLAGKLLRYFSRTPLFDDRFCDGTYLLARRDSPQTL